MLLGLDPRYRRRDDRLDTRVFSTVLAVIGAGLAFLLTVVALSFPQWIGPRTFVSRLTTFAPKRAWKSSPHSPAGFILPRSCTV